MYEKSLRLVCRELLASLLLPALLTGKGLTLLYHKTGELIQAKSKRITMSKNFKLQNGQVVALTSEADKLMKCPTERLETANLEITWDVTPYDYRLQTYDLSEYGLSALEEEYLQFLYGL